MTPVTASRVAFVDGWSPLHAPGLARYADELLAAFRRTGVVPGLVAVDAQRSGGARVAWSQTVLPARLARVRPSLVHVAAPPVPMAWRGPVVLTLHDLSLLRAPQWHPRRRALLSGALLRSSVRGASRVIVPSRATAADAASLLHLDPARVHVIPEAAAGHLRRVTDRAVLAAAAQRYGIRSGCVLAVGTLEPRKNLGRLADACARLRTDGWDGQLVLAGTDGWADAELRRRLAAAGATTGELAIRALGHVPDADLPVLLSLAGAVAYPSLLDVPEPIDVVDVFRRPEATPDIAREAVAVGAKVFWLQLDIINPEAIAIAEQGGLTVIVDRCTAIEHQRWKRSHG